MCLLKIVLHRDCDRVFEIVCTSKLIALGAIEGVFWPELFAESGAAIQFVRKVGENFQKSFAGEDL